MKKMAFLLLIVLAACSADYVDVSGKVRLKSIQDSFPTFSSLSTATIHESLGSPFINQVGSNPVRIIYAKQIAISADWYDWETEIVPEGYTLQVSVTRPKASNVIPADTAFFLIRSAPSEDLSLYDDITSDYETMFGNIVDDAGKYIFFKYQFVDGFNNLSDPEYNTKQIQFSSSKVFEAQNAINDWLSNTVPCGLTTCTYVVTNVDTVSIDYNIENPAGDFWITSDTSFNKTLYYGMTWALVEKSSSTKASVVTKSNSEVHTLNLEDIYGCCITISMTKYPSLFSVLRVRSEDPYTWAYHFEGFKITIQ